MTVTYMLPALMLAVSTACLAPTPVITSFASAATQETSASATVQLTGFVELYPEEGVKLLSAGRELTLAGETDLALPLAGLEVLVTGRFVTDEIFWVNSVVRVPSRMIAGSAGAS